MIADYQGELLKLYNEYNNALKPMLALVEASLEKHPAAILNEIRALNDHIARCYLPEVDDGFIKDNIKKANSHLKRALLDCFKNLNVYYFKEVARFEEVYRKVDLTMVNNGNFYPQFLSLKKQAKDIVFRAKLKETTDVLESFNLYQDGYLAYEKAYNFIGENQAYLAWAKKRFFQKHKEAVIASIISLVIGSFLGSCVFTPMFDSLKNKFWPPTQSPTVQAEQIGISEAKENKPLGGTITGCQDN